MTSTLVIMLEEQEMLWALQCHEVSSGTQNLFLLGRGLAPPKRIHHRSSSAMAPPPRSSSTIPPAKNCAQRRLCSKRRCFSYLLKMSHYLFNWRKPRR
ncbi:hypothetical protein KSP39_PZI011451 [Platanthera zijinensis]|uniref:Uncharacterized protein n=1 Tax=Platanthera zijinensis TaxID=2320716 RepID=A0AAP0BHD7_9ASPA